LTVWTATSTCEGLRRARIAVDNAVGAPHLSTASSNASTLIRSGGNAAERVPPRRPLRHGAAPATDTITLADRHRGRRDGAVLIGSANPRPGHVRPPRRARLRPQHHEPPHFGDQEDRSQPPSPSCATASRHLALAATPPDSTTSPNAYAQNPSKNRPPPPNTGPAPTPGDRPDQPPRRTATTLSLRHQARPRHPGKNGPAPSPRQTGHATPAERESRSRDAS